MLRLVACISHTTGSVPEKASTTASGRSPMSPQVAHTAFRAILRLTNTATFANPQRGATMSIVARLPTSKASCENHIRARALPIENPATGSNAANAVAQ
jgi:hypothetical protein